MSGDNMLAVRWPVFHNHAFVLAPWCMDGPQNNQCAMLMSDACQLLTEQQGG